MNTFKKIAMISLLGVSVLPGFAGQAAAKALVPFVVKTTSGFAKSVAASPAAQALFARLGTLGTAVKNAAQPLLTRILPVSALAKVLATRVVPLGAAVGVGSLLPGASAANGTSGIPENVSNLAPAGYMAKLLAFGSTKLAQAQDGLVNVGGKVVEVITNHATVLGVCDLALKGYGAFGLARGTVAAVKALKKQPWKRTALGLTGLAAATGASYYFGLPGMVAPLVPAFVNSTNMLRAAGAGHVVYNVNASANETSGLGFCQHIVDKDGEKCNAQPLGEPSILRKLKAGIFGIYCPEHQHGWLGKCNHTK